MARILTPSEKKEIKLWAIENNLDLSYNKKLEFGNGFWSTKNILDLKAALLDLDSVGEFNKIARLAVGVTNLSVDADIVIEGTEKGLTILSYNNKTIKVKFNTLKYVNGFLSVSKELFN